MKTRLTKEENEIVESFEQGEWIPVKDLSKRKKRVNAVCAEYHEKGQTNQHTYL
jgi:hypothetical protein